LAHVGMQVLGADAKGAQFGCQGLAGFVAAAGHNHARAFTSKGQRSRTADACYGAGNQHNGGLGIHRGFLKGGIDRWTSISALCDDLTQHVERLVSRRKSRIGSYLEQCLTQLSHGPPEVQRAAQVRLELLVVSGGGEHRHHHQAAIFKVQTGPIPHSTPDVLDGGLEKRRQKRIAFCPRTLRFTEYALTDRCAARPYVLCYLLSLVHRCFSFSGLRSPMYLALIGLSSPNGLPFHQWRKRADPQQRRDARCASGSCKPLPSS